jgi:hypothetical protein
LVTVALELWQSDCRQTKPTRWGGVRLRAETTRVSFHARYSSLQKPLFSGRASELQKVIRFITATSIPVLASPVSGGFLIDNVFHLAGKVNLCPSSFLVSR